MLISVITINYNNHEGLRRTIESVVHQTNHDYEFVVIDGGSTDGSVDVITAFSDKIDFWVSEPDRGIYHAMNKGVMRAHGDYCIFMNSGDSFYDDTVLERVVSRGLTDEIIIGRARQSSSNLEFLSAPARPLSLYYFYSSALPHQSTFIKTELLRRTPYDETLKIVSDWKFFLQAIILDNVTYSYMDEDVARFDLDGISTTNPEKAWAEKEQVLKELFPSRVLADYQHMKQSECLTQTLTPGLRVHYGIDRVLFRLGKFLLKTRE